MGSRRYDGLRVDEISQHRLSVFLVAGEEEAVAGGVGARSVGELGSC